MALRRAIDIDNESDALRRYIGPIVGYDSSIGSILVRTIRWIRGEKMLLR